MTLSGQLAFIFCLCMLYPPSKASGNVYSKRVVFNGSALEIETSGIKIKQPKIALVMSGGGSRGIVHAGILKILQENDVPIRLLVGASIGSAIGGLYAAGYEPDEIVRITKRIDWDAIYRDETQRSALFWGQKGEQDRFLLPVRFRDWSPFIPVAISPGQKILNILADLVLKAQYQAKNDFDNLRVPFRSVTTDLVSGRQIVLKTGNLAESMYASLAMPLLFSPLVRDSLLLVDGGLVSNLPVDVARDEQMDFVIAVDVASPLRSKDRVAAPWEVVDQATTIMSGLSRRLQREKADILVQPELAGILNDDFSRVDELYEIGQQEGRRILPQIQKYMARFTPESDTCCTVLEVGYQNAPEIHFNLASKLHVKPGSNIFLSDILADLQTFIDSGQFIQVQASVDSLPDGIVVDFSFNPFRRISDLAINGNTRVASSQIRKLMFLQPGMRLDSKTLHLDLQQIINIYRESGYSLMDITSVKWDNRSGLLTIDIDEGHINKVKVVGNFKTRDYVIMREFPYKKGQVFNWKNVNHSLQNIYGTQLFERVNINIAANNPGYDLIIKVMEKSSVLLRLGGKYDSDRRIQAYTEFGDESFLGTGIKTMFVGRFGMRDGHVGFKIRDDRIFTTYLTFDLQGYYKWEINPITQAGGGLGSYREERRGVRFQVGQQMRRLGQVVAELRNENITDDPYDGTFNYRQNIDLRTFALRALSDKRDRIDFPTKGIYNHWAWESGNRLVLETRESYTKALVNLEGYYTFNSVNTWHLRLFVGIGDRGMPFSENFRLGGLHNFYGLHENEYFGRQLFTTNAEYRYRLPFRLKGNNFLIKNSYISVRYDFGGIWKNPALVFSTDDFFSAIGAYLGIDTLFGPMYFAYGRTTRGTGVAYFSLGFSY